MNLNVSSRYGDHYEWNKVVTCIHNVLSQQRYLEHYGEVTIRNLKSNVCTCKITFVKVNETTSCSAQPFSLGVFGPTACLKVLTDNFVSLLKSRYWGSDMNKNEVQGTVLDQGGSIIHRFGGLWHEGIFCDTLPTPKCVWKPSESMIVTNKTCLQNVFIYPIFMFHVLMYLSWLLRFCFRDRGFQMNDVKRSLLPELLIGINPSITFVQQLTWEACVAPQISSQRITCCTMASPPSPWSWMNSPQTWSLSCPLQTAACAPTKGEKSSLSGNLF